MTISAHNQRKSEMNIIRIFTSIVGFTATVLLLASCGRQRQDSSNLDTTSVVEEAAIAQELGMGKAYMSLKGDSIIVYADMHFQGYEEGKFYVSVTLMYNDDSHKDDPYVRNGQYSSVSHQKTLTIHTSDVQTKRLRYAFCVDDCGFAMANINYTWKIEVSDANSNDSIPPVLLSDNVDFVACMGGVVEYAAYDEAGHSTIQHPTLIHPDYYSSEKGNTNVEGEPSSNSRPTSAVCPACHGVGQVMCSVCGGAGTNPRYYSGSVHYDVCSACGGAGFILCAGCGGCGNIFYR